MGCGKGNVDAYSGVGRDRKEGERKQGAEQHEDGQKEKEGW